MKALLLISITFFYFSSNSIAQSIAINSSGSDPDSTAMLDVQSTSKGILVPRLSTVQRQGISNPAEGLLVFDTGLMSFVFYQGGLWVELVNATSGLRDADNDTRISVEETVDEDTIRFFVKGSEFATMDGRTFQIGDDSNNLIIGKGAGENSSTVNSIVIGRSAGINSSGQSNSFFGNSAGRNNQGSFNTFMGSATGDFSNSGSGNTFLGSATGTFNTSGFSNTFIGRSAGANNSTGSDNTFIGTFSGGGSNFASGSSTGMRNVMVGRSAGLLWNSGSSNTIIGDQAGAFIESGNNNTYFGQASGFDNVEGIGNVFLGYNSGYFETGDNKLYIANSDDTTPLIYGDFNSNYATIHGNLGINKTDPDRELVVFDTDNDGDAALKLSTNSSNREMLIAVDQANGGFISMETNNDLQLRTNGVTRMVVEDGGDVGIGTTDPTFPLHVADNGTGGSPTINLVIEANTSNRPTILFSESGSTTGLNNGMSIEYNGEASGNEMTINAVGGAPVLTVESTDKQVGIGTTEPAFALHVNDPGTNGSPTINLVVEANTSNRPTILFSENGGPTSLSDGMSIEYNGDVSGNEMTINAVGGNPVITFESASGEVGIGTTNPTALLEVIATTVKKTAGGTWTASSDRRLKQAVVNYQEGLKELMMIRPVQFRYNDISGYNTSEEHIGVIAQELQDVAPHMVSSYERDGTDYLQVDNSAMTYMLINAVQEQQTMIKDLIEQNSNLSERILALEKKNQ